jgi:hypothetical protein
MRFHERRHYYVYILTNRSKTPGAPGLALFETWEGRCELAVIRSTLDSVDAFP